MILHAIIVFLTMCAVTYKMFKAVEIDWNRVKGFKSIWIVIIIGFILIYVIAILFVTYIAFVFDGDIPW